MANNINSVILIGNCTKDGELAYTKSGTPVCKVSIAVNRKMKAGGEWTDEVSFFDIVIWGKQGEALSRYLEKGKPIAVAGELRQNRWEHDGQKRSKVEVVANNVQLLGTKPTTGDPKKPDGGWDESFSDDIPF